MRLTRLIPIAFASFLAACDDGPSSPPAGAIVGEFGGPGLELTVSGRTVRVQFPCYFAQVPSAVVPDAEGNFFLPSTAVPVRGLPAPAGIELRGKVTGDKILLTVVTTTSRQDAVITNYTLTRGQPGDFSLVSCAAS